MSERRNTLPFWPAAMDQKTAAQYCGVSVDTFKSACPVKPVMLTQSTRGRRYLRQGLDEWLASLDPNRHKSAARKFGDRISGGKGEAVRTQ